VKTFIHFVEFKVYRLWILKRSTCTFNEAQNTLFSLCEQTRRTQCPDPEQRLPFTRNNFLNSKHNSVFSLQNENLSPMAVSSKVQNSFVKNSLI